ncbi:MAG: oligosaccharide flippase family protein [Polyangiales bacterium]
MQLAELRGLTTLLFSQPSRLTEELRRRPSLMLFIANVAAQSISVGFSPVLSRLYSPDDFGVLGALNGLVVIAMPLVSLRYELSIPRAKTEPEAAASLAVTGVAIAVMSLVCGLATWLVASTAHGAFIEPLRPFLIFVPLAACASALFDTLAMEASRRGLIAPLASSKLTQSGLGVGGQLLLGFMHAGAIGLLIGFVINQAAGVTRLFRELVLGHKAARVPAWHEIRAAAVEHRAFPLYSSWSSSLEACSRWALQLLITGLWDPKIGGFIFLSDRIVGRPLMLVGGSLLPVYVAQLSRALRETPQRAAAIFADTLRRQALVTLAWTIGVVVLAPLVFGPLFGAAWNEAVPYVQVMTVAIAPGSALQPVSHTLQLVGQQRAESVISVAKVILILGALALCHVQSMSALFTLSVFAALQLLLAVVRLVMYTRAVRSVAAA